MNAQAHTTPSLGFYVRIWAILMGLLVVTWAVATVDLGPLNTIVAMAVAFTKMILVILFFMHVRSSTHVTWLFVASGFFFLIIMFTLTMGDYMSRSAFHHL